jgi:hypothetical protein
LEEQGWVTLVLLVVSAVAVTVWVMGWVTLMLLVVPVVAVAVAVWVTD